VKSVANVPVAVGFVVEPEELLVVQPGVVGDVLPAPEGRRIAPLHHFQPELVLFRIGGEGGACCPSAPGRPGGIRRQWQRGAGYLS